MQRRYVGNREQHNRNIDISLPTSQQKRGRSCGLIRVLIGGSLWQDEPRDVGLGYGIGRP